MALIGPNGGGKTTLLRTLMSEIPVLKGHFEFGTSVQVGYYAQSHEQLPPTGTPLSVVLDAQPMGEESARTFLGRFLFSDDDVFKPLSALSGGERSRLALGLLLLQRANFLVLDEPTNHLDVSARESLEEMLSGFPGTLLFVSHDRYFIDKLATRLWIVEDGQGRAVPRQLFRLPAKKGCAGSTRADEARTGQGGAKACCGRAAQGQRVRRALSARLSRMPNGRSPNWRAV